MKIEKGKLYLDTESKTLFKADFDSEIYGNFVSDKIAVRCKDGIDWKYVKEIYRNLRICDSMEHNAQKWDGDVLISLYGEGGYCTEEYYLSEGYHIIDIQTFKEFYPTEEEQDPYNWVNNALEAESMPINYVEKESNGEEKLKEDEEILRRAKEGVSDFKNIADSIADLLIYKNSKYGNAVLEPLQIFSGKCKAGTRLDDKLGRIKNSVELRKNDVADLIGYLILTCKENNWTDFSEFKD